MRVGKVARAGMAVAKVLKEVAKASFGGSGGARLGRKRSVRLGPCAMSALWKVRLPLTPVTKMFTALPLDPPGSIDDLLEDWCKIGGFQLFPNVSDGRRQVFPWDQS